MSIKGKKNSSGRNNSPEELQYDHKGKGHKQTL